MRTDGAARRARAFTLIELLVAIAVCMAFLGGAVFTFIQIVRAGDRSQARTEALAQARHALDTMASELKQARFGPPTASPMNLFDGKTATFPGNQGNRLDDDEDGQTDEEDIDGQANSGWAVGDDKHVRLDNAAVTPVYERKQFLGTADLDDQQIDYDVKFANAEIIFRTFPNVFNPTFGIRQVRFLLGTYDGQTNVLLREVITDKGGAAESTTTSPLAFNVVSFGALFYNSNPAFSTPMGSTGWSNFWSADGILPALVELPPTVYLTVSVYSGTTPLAILPPSKPVETVTLGTVVGIEAVLADGDYALQRNTY
ncbi:MAG: type II secretion system GspH family protein [Candidatus Sumerlaeaceae bacterium]|nr:type II secretion system GspH family protein [Candidatus Sumerlaeaceae bacterium]